MHGFLRGGFNETLFAVVPGQLMADTWGSLNASTDGWR
jgi:hypothetical protein